MALHSIGKKAIILPLAIFFLSLPLLSFAAAELSNAPTIGQLPMGTLEQKIIALIDFAWKLLAALAVVMFVFAGLLFTTAAGNESKVSTAKKAALWGVIGIGVAIVGFSIVAIMRGALGL